MARYYARGCVEGAREAYRTGCRELAEQVPPRAVDGLIPVYRTEGFKLAATSRSVELVEQALHGEAFSPRFLGTACPPLCRDSRARRPRLIKNLHVLLVSSLVSPQEPVSEQE
jgi:hypothetical protein